MGTIRTFDLNELINRNNASVFIETGTLHGDGVRYALNYPFKRIISIEIIPELAEKAREQFKDYSNVEIITGNSADVLKEILPTINENIIFWLDAHFPGCDAGVKTYDEIKQLAYDVNMPLEKEIEHISKRTETNKDILVCDDLWCYEDVTQNNLNDFDTHCRNHGHNIQLKDINDGKDLKFLYNTFNATHEFKKDYQHQGYLVVYPK